MPIPVQNLNIADFQQFAANAANNDQNLVVKENGFEARGKAGTFFAGKSASREAANALFNAIKQEYGDTVADTLAPQLRNSMIKGKPLSARTVQTVLAEAQEFRQALQNANANAVRTFAEGNRAPGDSRNIDAALAPLFAELGLDNAQQAALKDTALAAIANRAAESGKLLSFQDLKDISVSTVIRSVQDSYTDRLSAQHGLNAEQSAQMRELVQLAAAQARMAAPGQAPLTPGQICLAAERGELTGQKALLFAMGKCDHPDAPVRDAMLLTSDANRVDMALFCEASNFGGGISLNVRVLEHLPEMRQMQPEGPLTRETLWQGCFGESLPAAQAAKSNRDFYSDMLFKLQNSFAALKPNDPVMAGFNGMMFHAYGLSTEKCSQAVMGPTSLTLGDFIASPSLYAVSRLPIMDAAAANDAPRPVQPAHVPDENIAAMLDELIQEVPIQREDSIEHQLARDLYRRGTHQGIQGFSPVISFGAPGQPVQSVNIQDVAGLPEADQAAFRDGRPSAVTADLIRHCRELCNGNEMQARALAMGMTQAGTMFTRTLSPATGVIFDEHAPHHMDARRNEDGTVSLRIYTPENAQLDADYTFTIQPDGQSKLTAFHLRPTTDDPVVNIQRDPRFSAMPERSQATLLEALNNVRANMPQGPEQQAALERLKNDFFGIMPAAYDINMGMQRFKDENLIDGFLQPTQQGYVDGQGIHDSFIKDTVRGSIRRMGDVLTPGNMPKEFYIDNLLRLVPEEHRRFLPFVSMMASQAGMDCALSFLPHLSGASDIADMHLIDAGIASAADAQHDLDLIPTEHGLRMELTFSQPYKSMSDENDAPGALLLNGRLTMDIDFTAEPEVHQVDVMRRNTVVEQRTVYVPHCTLLDGDILFTAPRI